MPEEPTFKELYARVNRAKREVSVGGICMRGTSPALSEDVGINGNWSGDASSWVKTGADGSFAVTLFRIPAPDFEAVVEFWAKNSQSEHRPKIRVTE